MIGGGADPALPALRPLGDGVAIGCRLGEGEIVPRRNPFHLIGETRIEGRGIDRLAGDLGVTRRLAGIAAQAGQRTYGLPPDAILTAGETDVTIVQFIRHRRLRPDRQSTDKVLRFIAIEDEAVHDTDGFRPGVEIEPDAERQPLPRAVRVLAVKLDHRAHRSGLFEHGADDLPLERRLFEIGLLLQRRGVLRQGIQGHGAHGGLAGARGTGNQGLAGFRHGPGQVAGDNGKGIRRLADRQGCSWRHRFARCQSIRSLCGCLRPDGMSRPFQRSIRPVGDWPGLHREIAKRETGFGADCSARPRHAEGHAFAVSRRCAIEPDGFRSRCGGCGFGGNLSSDAGRGDQPHGGGAHHQPAACHLAIH